jgi:integrase
MKRGKKSPIIEELLETSERKSELVSEVSKRAKTGRSNPVAPTIQTVGKSKVGAAIPVALPGAQSPLYEALLIAGQALITAAHQLHGKPAPGFAPVARGLGAEPLTLNELINEFLRARARAGRADRYLRQLRVSLKNFAAGRGRRMIGEIKTTEIEKWLAGQEWAPKTMRGYLGDVSTLFNFAARRGYVERNPARGVELPVLDGHATIEIHTPDQVRQVLEYARRADLDVCRHLAVRYFAGVRSAEAHRLRETDVKLDHGLIEVPAVKSKTRSRRLVTIQPNLRAWLDLGGELRAVGDMTVRGVIRLSKVPWPHNVARHSFVSYHLAHFKKTNETALEAGHTEQMLFAHYRALVTPVAAAEFWAIKPA